MEAVLICDRFGYNQVSPSPKVIIAIPEGFSDQQVYDAWIKKKATILTAGDASAIEALEGELKKIYSYASLHVEQADVAPSPSIV